MMYAASATFSNDAPTNHTELQYGTPGTGPKSATLKESSSASTDNTVNNKNDYDGDEMDVATTAPLDDVTDNPGNIAPDQATCNILTLEVIGVSDEG